MPSIYPLALVCVLLFRLAVSQPYLSTVQVDGTGNIVMNTTVGASCLCNGNDLVAMITSVTSQINTLMALLNAPCQSFEMQLAAPTTTTSRVCMPVLLGSSLSVDVALFPVANMTLSITFVPGYVSLVSSSFISLFALPYLTFVGQYIDVSANSMLTIFSINALTSIPQYLHIYKNDALTSFSASALTYVGQYVDIHTNQVLTSVSASAVISIACANNACTASQFAVTLYLCSNNAMLTYSSQLVSAAGQLLCAVPPSCANIACSCLSFSSSLSVSYLCFRCRRIKHFMHICLDRFKCSKLQLHFGIRQHWDVIRLHCVSAMPDQNCTTVASGWRSHRQQQQLFDHHFVSRPRIDWNKLSHHQQCRLQLCAGTCEFEQSYIHWKRRAHPRQLQQLAIRQLPFSHIRWMLLLH